MEPTQKDARLIVKPLGSEKSPMADAEQWRRRIAEVDGKKAEDRDAAARRAAHLEERRATLLSQATSELELFLRSEEADLIKRELGNIDRRAVHRAYEQARAGSGNVHFPANILVSSQRPIPHHRLSGTFAFTRMGLTEFYPAYNFFGIPLPAGRFMVDPSTKPVLGGGLNQYHHDAAAKRRAGDSVVLKMTPRRLRLIVKPFGGSCEA